MNIQDSRCTHVSRSTKVGLSMVLVLPNYCVTVALGRSITKRTRPPTQVPDTSPHVPARSAAR
jgi:hypothetical protein